MASASERQRTHGAPRTSSSVVALGRHQHRRRAPGAAPLGPGARGPATARSSPARPTSPTAARVRRHGEAQRRRRHGQRQGHVDPRLVRPAGRRPSRRRRRAPLVSTPQRASRTASSSARRWTRPGGRRDAASRQPTRRAPGPRRGSIATRRWSRATTTPGTSSAGRAQRTAASATSRRPSATISSRPTSPVGPKRCLSARSERSVPWRSPSMRTTVSTRCSRARGPASSPSLVTWPTRMSAVPASLAPTAQSRSAAWRTWGTEPTATPASASSLIAEIESTTHSAGRRSRISDSIAADVGGRGDVEAVGHVAEARARGRPGPADSSAAISRTDVAAGGPGDQGHQGQRRLADPGLAEEQGRRPGDQPAAEDPVELADPGRGPARPPRRATSRSDVATARRGRRRARSSSSVFHSPQPGHRPLQRGDVVPHSRQTCDERVFTPRRYGARCDV